MANRGAMLRATSSPLIGHLNHEFPGTRRHYTQAAEAGRGGQAVFGFEVGQYEIWPDFAQLARYDGVTLPHNLAMIRRRAAQTGAGACWTAGVAASGELALLCYKEEVEAALRTPAMSGLSLLGLQDFPGQGTALVGMMDALAEPKPYAFAAPTRFKAFFAPVLPLARFDRYTFAAGDVFAADLELANYGRATVGALHWLLYDDTAGCPLDGGELAGPFAPGGLRGAGAIACRLPDDGRAHRLTLRLRAGSAANAYPLWCYPDAPAEPAPAGVRVLTRLREQDLGWIAAGGRALLDPDAALPGSLPCAFRHDGAADRPGPPGAGRFPDRIPCKLAVVGAGAGPRAAAARRRAPDCAGAGQRDPAWQPCPFVGGAGWPRAGAAQRHGAAPLPRPARMRPPAALPDPLPCRARPPRRAPCPRSVAAAGGRGIIFV